MPERSAGSLRSWLGTIVFLVVAPGVVAGLVPWLITGWRGPAAWGPPAVIWLVAAVLILLIGHGLNIVMGLLSVVVHGVRLNLLEFSGQLGMEWAGIAYDPFKKQDKLKK